MDAMASSGHTHPKQKLGQLWQFPLLILSLGLFGYAAYLFIDPRPGLTIDQKIEAARIYLKHDRPNAAIDHLNRLLVSEKLDKPHEGQVHLLISEALDAAQKQKKISIDANH